MPTLQNINNIESRIVKLLSQKKLAIFLDIDGTLIPHADHPNNIMIPKNLRFILYNLRNKLNGALALISGRMVKDIQKICRPLKLSVSGIHGLEYTNNLGEYLKNNTEPIPLDIYEKLYQFSKNHECLEWQHLYIAPGFQRDISCYLKIRPVTLQLYQ